ncbi:MAG: iron-sulfur cluster assembly scaffold protein [Thermoproteota archaeon]
MTGSTKELQDLLKRFKNPINYGVIDNADAVSEEADYSCGDKVKIYLKFVEGRVINARFTSEACLFCNASASLLTDLVKGKTIDEMLNLRDEDLLGFFNADSRSPRYRCIMLPLKALRKALKALNPDLNI